MKGSAAALAAVLLLSGCSSIKNTWDGMSQTGQGATAGGTIGAAVGTGVGALIGGGKGTGSEPLSVARAGCRNRCSGRQPYGQTEESAEEQLADAGSGKPELTGHTGYQGSDGQRPQRP